MTQRIPVFESLIYQGNDVRENIFTLMQHGIRDISHCFTRSINVIFHCMRHDPIFAMFDSEIYPNDNVIFGNLIDLIM